MSTVSVSDRPFRAPRRGAGSLKALAANQRNLLGASLLGFVIIVTLVGFLWTPYPPDGINVLAANLSPSRNHFAGTDELGRDIFSRIVVGARVSLEISVGAALGALIVGSTIGFLAGYIGGVVDLVLSRIVDMLLAIPALATALGIVAILGPSASSVAIALASAYTPSFARVIRSNVVAARDRPYVEASRGLGVSTMEVLRKDVLPNVAPIIAVQATMSLAWGVVDEAALGFLGLGVQPPQPSWGSLLTEGREYLYQVPWLPISAGIAVVITVLGFNLFGDGLRDIFDPRTSRG
jgi:peptide/nickel transport system permease protein